MSRTSSGVGKARVTLDAVIPGPPGVTGAPPPIGTAPLAPFAAWMAELSAGVTAAPPALGVGGTPGTAPRPPPPVNPPPALPPPPPPPWLPPALDACAWRMASAQLVYSARSDGMCLSAYLYAAWLYLPLISPSEAQSWMSFLPCDAVEARLLAGASRQRSVMRRTALRMNRNRDGGGGSSGEPPRRRAA